MLECADSVGTETGLGTTMSNAPHVLSVGLLLAAVSTTAIARQAPMRGYQPQDAAAVAALPVYVVVDQATLRPEIAYGYQSMSALTPGYSNMSMAQGVGVNLAGTLIASAIINGAAYAKAKHFAQPPYHMLQQAQCDLSVVPALGDRVAAAVRGNWPSATVKVVTLQPGQKLASAIDSNQPRYVFRISSSLATDFSAVITSIDSEAYLPQAGSAHAGRTPAWRDTVIAVSDQLAIAGVKSQADIDAMVDAESARFVQLDLDDRIRKVNDAGPDADRRERKRLVELLLEHDRMLKEAASDEWSPEGEAMRRALLLSAGHCQQLNASVQLSSAQAAQLVTALSGGQLPAMPPENAPIAADALPAGVRQAIALPGGIVVSQRTGDNVDLGYRYSLLAD